MLRKRNFTTGKEIYVSLLKKEKKYFVDLNENRIIDNKTFW